MYRIFLLKTSILDRFTAPLCDAIVEQDGILLYDAQAMLERLDQANLFIIPLDHERRWYRYHRLFADLLRHRLDMVCESELVALLHARAGQWYEASSFPADAMHHALTGCNWDRVATLILNVGESMLKGGEVTTLLVWLQTLPEEVCARAGLCLSRPTSRGREVTTAAR
jgi:LuxR family maltose regulon positive regulatory protein